MLLKHLFFSDVIMTYTDIKSLSILRHFILGFKASAISYKIRGIEEKKTISESTAPKLTFISNANLKTIVRLAASITR